MVASLNILALDVGERRVGTAIANSISRLSSPLRTLTQDDSIITSIQDILNKENIGVLVIGLPQNLSGQDTDQTRYVREFSDKLHAIVKVPVFFEDEALSSVRARKTLDDSKKPYQKGDVDSLAACYILDDFIANHPEVVNV